MPNISNILLSIIRWTIAPGHCWDYVSDISEMHEIEREGGREKINRSDRQEECE